MTPDQIRKLYPAWALWSDADVLKTWHRYEQIGQVRRLLGMVPGSMRLKWYEYTTCTCLALMVFVLLVLAARVAVVVLLVILETA